MITESTATNVRVPRRPSQYDADAISSSFYLLVHDFRAVPNRTSFLSITFH